MHRTIIALAVACSTLTAVHAQQQESASRDNEVVFRSGPWFVVRTLRDFGNVVACTGFYRMHGGVQLSSDNMIIRTGAELRSISVGFDDKPLLPPREPTAIEKEMHAIVFAGADFEQLKRSSKLTLGLASDKAQGNHPIDLRGMHEALANIEQGCPEPAVPLRAQVQESAGRGTGMRERGGQGGATCGPRLIARMRDNGVSEQQIRAICQP
jgi:hypothetical protein